MNHHDLHNTPPQGPNWSRVNQWLLWAGLAAATAWLVVRHGAHLLEVAPFLIILVCPLMHVFGHGGHGGHGGQGGYGRSDGSVNDRPAPRAPGAGKATAQGDPPVGGHSH